jgi:hypothetical protein
MDGGAREQITEHLTEVHRLVRQGARATSSQVGHLPLESYPEVDQAVREVQRRLANQAVGLEQRLTHLGHPANAASPVDDLPPASTERAGDAIEGDQVFLQHLSLEYQRLEAASRSQGDSETEELAGRGYKDIQSLLREQMGRAAPRAARADRPQPSMNPPGVVQESEDT